MPLWTARRSDRALELWNQGVPAIDIARELGVSRTALKSRLRRIGAPERDARARHEELARLYQSGMSVAAIARQTGFTYSGVWSALVNAGIKTVKPHRKDKPVKLDKSDYRAAVAKHDETITRLRRAGVSYRRIAKEIGHSAEAVRQRVAVLGGEPEAVAPQKPAFPAKDDAYVMRCLGAGGFVYREVRNGRVVEVRP